MPSKSAKQARFMRAVAHSPKFAKKAGVPQSVGREYMDADQAAGRYVNGGKVEEPKTKLEKIIAAAVRAADNEDVANKSGKNPGNIQTKGARHRALMLKGLAAMLGTLDEGTGEIGFGTYPGLIDEMVGIPATFFDKAPDWSKRAKDRTERLRTRIDDQMPTVVPHGIGEHIGVATGEMLGQLPLPGGPMKSLGSKLPSALRYAGKVPGAFLEYLGPTIKPTLDNYVSGAMAGGLLGWAGDNNEREAQDMDQLTQLSQKYADGGRAVNTARAIKAIKEAIAHIDNNDHASAIRSLSSPDAASSSVAKQVLEQLRGPKAREASAPLRKAVEQDTNTYVPLLAEGGKVDKLMKLANWLDELTPETRAVVKRLDKKYSGPERRTISREKPADVDVSDVLARRKPYVAKNRGGYISC